MSLSTKKKITRCTNAQIGHLINFMNSHRNFANGEYSGPMGHRAHIEMWEELKIILKQHGPDKSVEQWRHTWRDLKKRSREEGARIRRARAETGNLEVPTWTDQTKKILEIIGTESAVGVGLSETGCGEPLFLASNSSTSSLTTLGQSSFHSSSQVVTQPSSQQSSAATLNQSLAHSSNQYIAPPSQQSSGATLSQLSINSQSQSAAQPTQQSSDTTLSQLSIHSQSQSAAQPTQQSPATIPIQSPSHSSNQCIALPRQSAPSQSTVGQSPLQRRIPEHSTRAQQRGHLQRANDFLLAERETRDVLRDISGQLVAQNNLIEQQNAILQRVADFICTKNN